MSNTIPMRVEVELFEAAKSVGSIVSRSATQQLNHWARIGRELEADPRISPRDIQRVLAGDKTYDNLNEVSQAVVRVGWDERVAERLASLDLAAEFTKAGRSWTEADAHGHTVVHGGAEHSSSADA
ncbi:TA system antitoxin ParD family protein [Arthrobacter alpinus]|nr:hypothetical protein [Arthrobacter alpinus]